MSIDSCFFVFLKNGTEKNKRSPRTALRFVKKQEVSPKKQTPLCFFEASSFTRKNFTRDI
jgi:hypothetical protein